MEKKNPKQNGKNGASNEAASSERKETAMKKTKSKVRQDTRNTKATEQQ